MSWLRALRFLLMLLALGAVLLPTGCAAPAARPASAATPTSVPQPLDLVVLHTNDVIGYTEPCG